MARASDQRHPASSSNEPYEPLLANDGLGTPGEDRMLFDDKDSASLDDRRDLLTYKPQGVSEQVTTISRRQARWITVLLIITLLLALFNAVLLAFPISSSSSYWDSALNDEGPLPTPDSYIGLRKMMRLNGWKESLHPFYNFPFDVALVDKTRRSDVIENARNTAFVKQSAIVPDNRHVVVNSNVSTILQFYTLEFGFEKCQITFSLTHDQLLSPSRTAARPSTIDVYLLTNPTSRTSITDAVLPISETMTYARRPEREKHLGRVSVPAFVDGDVGFEARSEMFDCEERSIQTVELVCAVRGDCDVDLWMNKYEGPVIGPRMMQHPTL